MVKALYFFALVLVCLPGLAIADDVNEITIWVRFSCSDPSGKIGFSGVKLEDIAAMDKVPTPQQIIEIERQAELELIRREKRALRKNLP